MGFSKKSLETQSRFYFFLNLTTMADFDQSTDLSELSPEAQIAIACGGLVLGVIVIISILCCCFGACAGCAHACCQCISSCCYTKKPDTMNIITQPQVIVNDDRAPLTSNAVGTNNVNYEP